MQPLPVQNMQILGDPKVGLHNMGGFLAPVTSNGDPSTILLTLLPLQLGLIKETNPWMWSAREEECFQELKKKTASSNCLGVPRPKGEIVLISHASDVGGA